MSDPVQEESPQQAATALQEETTPDWDKVEQPMQTATPLERSGHMVSQLERRERESRKGRRPDGV